eukprot:3727862-Prymnesium_polylepis.2
MEPGRLYPRLGYALPASCLRLAFGLEVGLVCFVVGAHRDARGELAHRDSRFCSSRSCSRKLRCSRRAVTFQWRHARWPRRGAINRGAPGRPSRLATWCHFARRAAAVRQRQTCAGPARCGFGRAASRACRGHQLGARRCALGWTRRPEQEAGARLARW